MVAWGSSMRAMAAAQSSPALWGGIEVAMPTAMPAEPLASRLGKPAGEDDGFLVFAGVGGAEIDGVVVEAGEQGAGDGGEAGLGVAHGGRVIAVDVAEIALALDQRIADGEVLGEADQRIVDRGVAVRVELAHDVAHDAGAFLEAPCGSRRSCCMP